MLRIVTLLSLVALLGACDKTDTPPAPADPPAAAADKTPAATDKTAAAKADDGHAHGESCACAKGKAGESLWCDHCGVGYVDGKKHADRGAYDKAVAAK